MTTPTEILTGKTVAPIEAERPAQLLVTIPHAASLLAVGRSTVYELIWRNELEPIKIGRSVRLRTSDLEAFVQRAQANNREERPDPG